MVNLVVARYIDGRVEKGEALNVNPSGSTFHLRTREEKDIVVRLADLKAAFFVRSLDGNPARVEGMHLSSDDIRARGAHPIEVEFADGEHIIGYTVRFPPVRKYYFIVPTDTASNNVRILVNSAAVVRVTDPDAAR